MGRPLRLLDALPGWLRWAVFFPVGVVCSIVVGELLEVGMDIAGLPRVQTTALTLRAGAGRFLAGLTFTLLPALLSPRPWPVGLAMFVIAVALDLAPIAYYVFAVPYMRARMVGSAGAIAGAVLVKALGGCVALALIRILRTADTAKTAEASAARHDT